MSVGDTHRVMYTYLLALIPVTLTLLPWSSTISEVIHVYDIKSPKTMKLNWYHDWGIPNSKDHALDLKKTVQNIYPWFGEKRQDNSQSWHW